MDSNLNNVYFWKATLDVKSGNTGPSVTPSPVNVSTNDSINVSPSVSPSVSPVENFATECINCNTCELNLVDMKKQLEDCHLTTSQLEDKNNSLDKKIHEYLYKITDTEEIGVKLVQIKKNRDKIKLLQKEPVSAEDEESIKNFDEMNRNLRSELAKLRVENVDISNASDIIDDLIKKLKYLQNLENEVSDEMKVDGNSENYSKVLELVKKMVTYKSTMEIGDWKKYLKGLIRVDVPPFNNPGFDFVSEEEPFFETEESTPEEPFFGPEESTPEESPLSRCKQVNFEYEEWENIYDISNHYNPENMATHMEFRLKKTDNAPFLDMVYAPEWESNKDLLFSFGFIEERINDLMGNEELEAMSKTLEESPEVMPSIIVSARVYEENGEDGKRVSARMNTRAGNVYEKRTHTLVAPCGGIPDDGGNRDLDNRIVRVDLSLTNIAYMYNKVLPLLLNSNLEGIRDSISQGEVKLRLILHLIRYLGLHTRHSTGDNDPEYFEVVRGVFPIDIGTASSSSVLSSMFLWL